MTINQGLSDLKPREKEVTLNGLIQNTFVDLVGGIPTLSKMMEFVSWDDYSQYIKNTIIMTNHLINEE